MIADRVLRWLGGPAPVVAAEVPPDEETRARRDAVDAMARELWRSQRAAWDAAGLEGRRKFASRWLFLCWIKRREGGPNDGG